MRALALSAAVSAVLLPAPVTAGPPPVVTYIGTNDHAIVNAAAAEAYGVRLVVYNLDAHRNLEKQLSADLPDDPVEAERIANERLEAIDGRKVQEAFRGVALAIQWDLRKAPAIVFGAGEQVIYGVTDLEEALKRWEFYRTRTLRAGR